MTKLIKKLHHHFPHGFMKTNLSPTTSRTLSSFQDADLTTHQVEFSSGSRTYEKWKKEKKFKHVPDKLKFNLSYIDTHKFSPNANVPTIVTLHGAPGSCKDYTGVIPFLYQNGARVIAPSFPDFTNYPPGIFRHSAEEKAELITDFLSQINIPQVDVLICHSSSIYPGLRLCLENKLIKSIVMMNTGTFSTKTRATRHMNLLRILIQASEIPICLKVMKLTVPVLIKFINFPVRADNPLDPLLSATVMVYGNIPQAKDMFSQLSNKRFPMLYMFSENDTLINKKLSYELAEFLGAHASDVYMYDSNGVLKQKGNDVPHLKVMSFENGSHYVFWKYPAIVNEAIVEFTNKIVKL